MHKSSFFPFLNGANPSFFLTYFRSFQTTFLNKKTVDFSGIRTWFIRVEGKRGGQYINTTVQLLHV